MKLEITFIKETNINLTNDTITIKQPLVYNIKSLLQIYYDYLKIILQNSSSKKQLH